MIESRLLVAKPFAFLLNQSRSRLFSFSRSGEATAYTTALLPRFASGKASTLLPSLAGLREGFLLGRFRQSERSNPAEIPHIERSRYAATARRSYHAIKKTFICRERSPRYTDRIDVHR